MFLLSRGKTLKLLLSIIICVEEIKDSLILIRPTSLRKEKMWH